MKRRDKPAIIVGIDPDSEASGIAVINHATGDSLLITRPFWELESLMHASDLWGALWVVENVWEATANWHVSRGSSPHRSAKIGYSMGRCATIGRLIYERLHLIGADVVARPPLRKVWRGAGGKVTHDEAIAFARSRGISVTKTRTNQEERDALLLALAER